MRTTLALIAAGLIATATLIAQTEDKPAADKPPEGAIGGLRFLDVTEVTVVNVDVSVMDKNGPVKGLRREDFEVYQDGKLQDISNFGFYSREVVRTAEAAPTAAPTATAAPAASPTPVPEPEAPPPPREPRFLALYVDNENIMPFNRNRVLTRMSEFIRNNLVAPDKAMVVSYQRSLKTQQEFTSDAEDIVDALRRLRTYTGGRVEANSSRKELEDFIRQNASNAGTIDTAFGRARAFANEQKNDLMFTVRTLQDLVQTMSGLPGKKSIIYVSDGLPWTPGLEAFYEIQEQYRETSAITSARDYEAMELYRSLVTTAAAAGVTLYTIDARGLEAELGIEAENRLARSTMTASIARSNYQDSLIYMAEQTGGRAIVNTNDVSEGLDKIGQELATFYSLGYRLIPSGEDRHHRIQVKVKGHSDYRLNYRRTFIEKSLATKVADRVVAGLTYDLEDNPLAIDASTGEPVPAANGRWTLPVQVRVPYEKMALLPDGKDLTGYLMVYYVARDNEGKQSELQRREIPVRVPSFDYEKAQRAHFMIADSLLVEPGVYRISIGVRDQLTNQAGYVAVRRAVHPELNK